jgi:hypothetical protein
MRIRNPFYLPFVMAVIIFVGLANHNGWSLVQSVATNTWRHLNPNTQHK